MTNYPIGAILGAQYRLEQEVGHGAMGRVFLARDLKHGRAVAVKMLHGDLTTSISIERFTREIQVISRLNHPHIVGLYDSGEFDGQLYYVMPLVEGDTLRDRLRREKRLPAEDAVRITLQICDALAYAHSHGIVHRDIKPDNILLPTRNHAVLADFGLSRALMTATDRRLTATGFSLGTPRYMSPEQTAGDREVDGRSDIYSLGTVLYEMLSGEPPFVDEDVRRLLARKLSEPPPELKARRPDVPVAVAGVVRTALATIPAERFKAADGFAAALQTAAFGARPSKFGKRGGLRRRTMPILAAVALVVMTIVYVFSRTSRSVFATGAITAQERVLIADFSTRSADTAIANMVTEAFRYDLEESSAVTVVEPRHVVAALGRMGRPRNTRLSYDVAREVALREGIAVVIDGDVTRTGGTFVLAARLIATADEQTLDALRVVARDSTEIINAIDELSAKVRRSAGEASRSVRRGAPLEQVTTFSLPALLKYAQAQRAIDYENDYVKAIPLMEEAIAIDTAFASASRALAITLSNQGGQQAQAFAMIQRAFRHRTRLTEKERLMTMASYYAFLEDAENAIAANRALLDLDPEHIAALTNMAYQYMQIGEYARAADAYVLAFRIDTTLALPLGNLVEAKFNAGNVVASRAAHEEYRRRFPDNPRGLDNTILMREALGQYAAAEAAAHELKRARSEDPRWRIDSSDYLSSLAAIQGRVREAKNWLRDVMSEQLRRGTPRGSLVGAIDMAELDLHLLRDTAAALAGVERALAAHPLEKLSIADRPYAQLGIFYAQAREPKRAREVLDSLLATADTARIRQTQSRENAIAAEIAIAEGRGRDALSHLHGLRHPVCRVCLHTAIGQAHELLGARDSAIAAYETYAHAPLFNRYYGDRVWLAFAYERLSELLEKKGDFRRAAEYARKLAHLWERADAPLQARRRAALDRAQRLSGTFAPPASSARNANQPLGRRSRAGWDVRDGYPELGEPRIQLYPSKLQ